MSNYIYFCVYPNVARQRFDKLLAEIFPAHTRAVWQRLIKEGFVQVNGRALCRVASHIGGGSHIGVDFSALPSAHDSNTHAENLPLDIVYEDNDIAIINKRAGMVMHPGSGVTYGTLQSALLFHYSDSRALPRAGIVHRLDKDTSGLIVVAKNENARQRLIAQFQERAIGREYIALVHGIPAPTGIINQPLASSPPKKMIIHRNGKEALTRYAIIKKWHNAALIRCWLHTGRTHQIRAHMEHIRHPIIGDTVYRRYATRLSVNIKRQALHAEKLYLIHPTSGQTMQWQTTIPEDIQTAIKQLDTENPCG